MERLFEMSFQFDVFVAGYRLVYASVRVCLVCQRVLGICLLPQGSYRVAIKGERRDA